MSVSSSASDEHGGEDSNASAAAFQERCDRFVASGLNGNPTLQFLLQNLVKLGCEPPPGFIRCMDCGPGKMAGGGFGLVQETKLSPVGTTSTKTATTTTSATSSNTSANTTTRRSHAHVPQCRQTAQELQRQLRAQEEGTSQLHLAPEIYLCQQHLRDKEHAHESLAHELIHAIDMCRTKMDPFRNCIHLACTEIRAENLSGECNMMKELANRQVNLTNFSKHGEVCVKRRAALSLKANPNCRDKADEYIDAAFDRCFRDTFPFDRHPNLR